MAKELVGQLVYKITGDHTQLDKAIQQSSQKLVAAGKKMQQVGNKLTLGITVPLLAIGGYLAKTASDAEEVSAKFGTAFRDVTKEADTTAEELRKNYGLSRIESERLLSTTGDLLKGFGATGAQALGLSDQVQKLAVDLASYNNLQGGASRASEIVTKAMLGERESLTALGIKISENDVQQRLLIEGKKDLEGRELLLAKAQTTLQLAMEQSGDAMGDFNRTQDSTANRARIAKARLEDLASTLGKELLPIANDILKVLTDVVEGFSNLDAGTRRMIIALAGIAAATGPALAMIGALSRAIGFLAANPTVLGLIAVAAAVAGIVAGLKAIENQRIEKGISSIASGMKDALKSGEDFEDVMKRTARETGLTLEQVIGIAEAENLITEEKIAQAEALKLQSEHLEKTTEQIVKENQNISDLLGVTLSKGRDVEDAIRAALVVAPELGIERLVGIIGKMDYLNDQQREQLEAIKERLGKEREEADLFKQRATQTQQFVNAERESKQVAADRLAILKKEAEERSKTLTSTAEKIEQEYTLNKIQLERLRQIGEIDEAEYYRSAIGLVDQRIEREAKLRDTTKESQRQILEGYQKERDEMQKILNRYTEVESNALKAMEAENQGYFSAVLDMEYAAYLERQRLGELEKEAKKKQLEDFKTYALLTLNTINQILGSINQMFSNATQGRLAELDREYDQKSQAEQAYQDFLLAKLQAQYESLSDEDKAEWDLREAAHEAEIARQDELDKKKRQLVHDEAIRNRAFAIMNIILATAQAIIAALASIPPNVPLSIANAAIGLAQLAAATTVPIPSLAEGGMLTQDKIIQAHAGEVIVDVDTLAAALRSQLVPPSGSMQLSGPVILRVGSRDINGYFESEIDNGRILVNPRSIKKR